jgi:lysophospholipase L1-like esterase
MPRNTRTTRTALASALILAALAANPASAAPAQIAAVPGGWSTAWGTAPAAAVPNVTTGYPGVTIRNVVHTTIRGSRARVRLSNRFGTAPVFMGHVTLALSDRAGGTEDGRVVYSDGTVKKNTMRTVTFGGQTSVTISAGAEVVSDGVDLNIPRDYDAYVTMWTPKPSGTVTVHPEARQTNGYWDDGADHAADLTRFPKETYAWHYVSGLEVNSGPGTIVTLGDSITDGVTSSWAANRRWSDYLAQRLQAQAVAPRYGVANAGIGGNRVILDDRAPDYTVFGSAGRSALARLGWDVLDRAGAKVAIVLEGINDIQQTPHQSDPVEIIAGLQQVVAQCRARGLRVIGATIMAWEGWSSYTPALEAAREGVNFWIRTSGAFDAVADMDAATRDPANPHRLAPAYDSGDHLHPNDAGDQAMAASVPVDLL